MMEKQKFIPLNRLLLEDNEHLKQIKSLQQREEEYAYLLGPIEETIALHYSENRKLKDKDVTRILKNLRANYSMNLDFFKEPLEKEILIQLSFAAQYNNTMHRELFLAISYILWSIDNRNWIGDSRAYLDWVLNFFGMMDKKEKMEFKEKYDALGKKFGIEEEKIRVMTSGSDDLDEEAYEPSDEEKEWSKEESKYFAMSDSEKCEYFLKCKDEGESLMALKELMELSEQYLQNGEFEKSLSILNRLASGELNKELREVILSLRIECLICLKDYTRAENRIEELIHQNKDYPMAYFHRAVISFKENNLKDALEHTEESIRAAEKVDMRHPQYYQMKANILKKLGDDNYKKFEKIAENLAKDNFKMLKKFSEENGINMDEFEELMK